MTYAIKLAVDSSSLIAYIKGEKGNDIGEINRAITVGGLFMPPIVWSEILSDFALSDQLKKAIKKVPLLSIKEDYWERAGLNRVLLLSKRLKCKIADALIAQSCIDHNTPLITRDTDFRHFAKHCGLKLA